MTGKTQSEAVSILRSVRLGGVVNLVLSRQESGAAATPEKVLPRELPEEKTAEDPTNAKNKAVLVFDIPLNDTGSAGLGVSVKGKTSGNGTDGETKDLGIFIKSVIHGGAASKVSEDCYVCLVMKHPANCVQSNCIDYPSNRLDVHQEK